MSKLRYGIKLDKWHDVKMNNVVEEILDRVEIEFRRYDHKRPRIDLSLTA